MLHPCSALFPPQLHKVEKNQHDRGISNNHMYIVGASALHGRMTVLPIFKACWTHPDM